MSLRSLQALCLTSFFIADVRDGLGPFLGIFLTERHWQPDEVGFLMTAGGVAGLLATLPAGFITDTSKNKRALLAVLCVMITVSTLLIWFSQGDGIAAFSQIISGVCAAFVGPLITGITLGLTGQNGFSAQMGKNEAFNHAGNFLTALIGGGIAWYWGIGGIFLLMACTVAGEVVTPVLTTTEFKLLTHLARNPRKVCSCEELLDACLSEGDSLDRTVDSHMSKLRKKLENAGLKGVPDSIRGLGYRLGENK